MVRALVLALLTLSGCVALRNPPAPALAPPPLRCAPLTQDPLFAYGAGYAERSSREASLEEARRRAQAALLDPLSCGPEARLAPELALLPEEVERAEQARGALHEACIVVRVERASATPCRSAESSEHTWVRLAEPAEPSRRSAPWALRAGEVLVPAGPFLFGCDPRRDPRCDDDERPARTLELPAFALDRTEVTVAAYRRCVDAGACVAFAAGRLSASGATQAPMADGCNWALGRANHPMNCVSFDDAEDYCAWRGARLPTEQEWEKATRGPHGARWPWGDRGYLRVGRVANIADETAERAHPSWIVETGYDDGFVGTAPVGSFPRGASIYGALDLIGNVWEWTRSARDDGELRTLRGGSFANEARLARASDRFRADRRSQGERYGFRCARDAGLSLAFEAPRAVAFEAPRAVAFEAPRAVAFEAPRAVESSR